MMPLYVVTWGMMLARLHFSQKPEYGCYRLQKMDRFLDPFESIALVVQAHIGNTSISVERGTGLIPPKLQV
jgi:hypothetical protein